MIWLDAHLSPRIALWLSRELGVEAWSIRDKNLRDASDGVIFEKARREDVIFITKDKDFADMVSRLGSPPKVVWLRCGNTSEVRLKEIFREHLLHALVILESEEDMVEIR